MNQPRDLDTLQGVLLDENLNLGLDDLARSCGISAELLTLLVGEGLLSPQGQSPADWRFNGIQIYRVRRALRLSHDLELDWPATALALDLIEEIEQLRARIHSLEMQLQGWI